MFKIIAVNNKQEISFDVLFEQFYLKGAFSDLRLKGVDGSVPAHKILLCGFSAYFRNMLTSTMKESSSNEIDLSGYKLTQADLELFLKPMKPLMMFGDIQVNTKSLQKLKDKKQLKHLIL